MGPRASVAAACSANMAGLPEWSVALSSAGGSKSLSTNRGFPAGTASGKTDGQGCLRQSGRSLTLSTSTTTAVGGWTYRSGTRLQVKMPRSQGQPVETEKPVEEEKERSTPDTQGPG